MLTYGDIVEVWDEPARKTYGVFIGRHLDGEHAVYAIKTYEVVGEERRMTYFRHHIRFVARLGEAGAWVTE